MRWGEQKGDNAPVIIVTYYEEIVGETRKTMTAYEKTNFTHSTFQQLAAMAYNEGGGSNNLDKFRIAYAIVNKANLKDSRKQESLLQLRRP